VNPDTYEISDPSLPFIHADGVARLATEEHLHRQRRAAPADVAPDTKSQYQSVSANATAAAETTVTTVDSKTADVAASVSYNVHNVGVNGTGQRKTADAAAAAAAPAAAPTAPTSINVAAKKPTQLAAQSSGYPKKVGASAAATTTTTPAPLSPGIDVDVSNVDVPDEAIEEKKKNETLVTQEDRHDYYDSVFYINKNEANALWAQLKDTPENVMLSSSHRRAMTVEMKFDFPFYGHFVRNITVATGGFIYTGEYVHSWLAATQYIAPLMANFDTSISSDSFVRVNDNGTAFTTIWENVTLQDKPEFGKFTFSVTLHKNGDIVFVYYQVPTDITSIQDNQHPVKVGLSDAYIIDKHLIFARRKTIYEYHRVSFKQPEIATSTIIRLTAQPTCLGYSDCQACIGHNTTFTCLWCPALNRCSTGTDRKKHEWMQKGMPAQSLACRLNATNLSSISGCDTSAVRVADSCPALGTMGNNAAQMKNGSASAGSAANGSSSSSASASSSSSTSSTASSPAVTEPTVVSTRSPHATAQSKPEAGADGSHPEERKLSNAELSAQAEADNKSVGVAFGFMVPICLVFAVTLWLFYAYRNPHTKSGQLLIQFRPSQWSWRRGEARYTAATIHM
ncbi:hypothetical protein KR018_000697, partial [Drosophila ironensis]